MTEREKTKIEIVMFCPDCLGRMQKDANPNPNIYTHSVASNSCGVDKVQLNGKFEISKIWYLDGTTIEP
ncbi:MAG: hypothetical protein IBV52_08435 [Candidatus Bathyarchaeota archaeon]